MELVVHEFQFLIYIFIPICTIIYFLIFLGIIYYHGFIIFLIVVKVLLKKCLLFLKVVILGTSLEIFLI